MSTAAVYPGQNSRPPSLRPAERARGEHILTIPVLTRILVVLDEQLLISVERKTPGQEPEREVAPAPEPMSA